MKKLKSLDNFKLLQERLIANLDKMNPTLVITAGTCGQASGANDVIRVAKREIIARGMTAKIKLRITGCYGFCEAEPSILIEPYGAFYPKVNTDSTEKIINAVANKEVIGYLLYKDPSTGKSIEKMEDIPFFSKQLRTILSYNQKVDPIRVYNYLENGGYAALANVLEKGDPNRVIQDVIASGIRGRGGAGFPTGIKWELLKNQKNGTAKYIVCNADEGDPGAYMDRSVLEGNPHSIIEGMIICAFGTGATNGVIYVRNEYPLAIKHLIIALRQAYDLGFVGENILGTDFSFDLKLVRGAGAFVCGEETALMKSIEGKMGEPRQRPPFPIEKGIWGHPTCINNVETLANIPVIIGKGAENYIKVGVPGNTGTKIFSLVGKIRNTGLVEVPLGTKLKEVIYDIGGGSASKSRIKAVQTGGPSGGCIPAHMFDIPIDYDSLRKVGSIMGSGGMIVMDENTCMVDIARYYMKFLKEESCGKCYTCRKGTQRMYELLDDITKGIATLEHIDLLVELAEVVRDTTMCGLGQTASNPVLSTIKYFREEYIEHITNKRCPAGVCRELVGAPCQAACPVGTEAWRYVAHIANGDYEKAYLAIREYNPFPSICARVCDHKCEERCKLGQTGTDPVAIRALKRFVTDNVDPSVYKPKRSGEKKSDRVAIIGSGPAGLTAAHNLSLIGYQATVFEADHQPGGMLNSCIPEYRLPQNILKKEIEAIFDENVTLKCDTELGKDITIESLFADGYKAVFIGIGAQKGKRLHLDGESSKGVYPSIEFLKAYSQDGEEWAKGRVGVIGGGNSAFDAARTALRQKDVKSVVLLYRRTREEMPAFSEEIEAAIEEGILVETLVTPTKIIRENGNIKGLQCVRNSLGEVDNSGRRSPVLIPGSEYSIELDTLIIAISEQPDTNSINPEGEPEIKLSRDGTLDAEKDTLCCSREGVFAGGDVITGPNTVIDAIAAGKRASVMIDRYLRGEELHQPEQRRTPSVYIPPCTLTEEESEGVCRAEAAKLEVEQRLGSFVEVEKTLVEKEAVNEARRCLRCDLEFTQPKSEEVELVTDKETSI